MNISREPPTKALFYGEFWRSRLNSLNIFWNKFSGGKMAEYSLRGNLIFPRKLLSLSLNMPSFPTKRRVWEKWVFKAWGRFLDFPPRGKHLPSAIFCLERCSGFSSEIELALFRSLCNKRQLSRKKKFDKLSEMFPALVFVAFGAQNFA